MSPDGLVFPRAQNYSDPTTAVVQSWRGGGRWFTQQWSVNKFVKENSTLIFDPKTGMQGGEGMTSSGQWWIENVKEEVDDANEWFFDASEQMLYFNPNRTDFKSGPSGREEWAVPVTRVLFNINGTQEKPVKNISIKGLVLRDTRYTYLDTHGMPSGGDWALERTACIFFERTTNLMIDTIKMTRIGGNGIMFSKYNMRPTVKYSAFEWMGSSAIASWGFTDEISDKGIHGIDGTGGDFPRYIHITHNLFREIGIWEKQSSAYFQAKAAESLIEGNVVFNLGRAGFNYNDGFGGGDNITQNVLFNTCRESSDHGPINSWDRQPFLTTVKNGTATTEMAFRNVWRNFIIANYGGAKEVDNDDGSLFWNIHSNFMAYGWAQKFKCGAIYSYDNVKAFLQLGGKFDAGCLTEDKNVFYPNLWHNDTLIALGSNDFNYRACWGSDGQHDWDKTQVFNNSIYLETSKVNAMVSGCDGKTITLAQLQKEGKEPGSRQFNAYPPTSKIIQWAKEKLGKFQ